MYLDQLLLAARKAHVVYLDQLLGAALYIYFISYHDLNIYFISYHDKSTYEQLKESKPKQSNFEIAQYLLIL